MACVTPALAACREVHYDLPGRGSLDLTIHSAILRGGKAIGAFSTTVLVENGGQARRGTGVAFGWVLAYRAANSNLYIEPTDDAVRAAAAAVPLGVVGAAVMVLAPVMYGAWARRAWLAAEAVRGVLVGILLAAEPNTSGGPFLALVLTAAGAPGYVAARLLWARSMRPLDQPN